MRTFRAILGLAPDSLDLDATPREPTGGAVVIVRDVLNPPDALKDEETDIPAGWGPGRVSPTPALLRAASAAFGKRSAVPGRHGARVYLARLAAPSTVVSWTAQLPAVAQAVRDAQDERWRAPEAVLVWRAESVTLAAELERHWPGVPVRWVASKTAAVEAMRWVASKTAAVEAMRGLWRPDELGR